MIRGRNDYFFSKNVKTKLGSFKKMLSRAFSLSWTFNELKLKPDEAEKKIQKQFAKFVQFR